MVAVTDSYVTTIALAETYFANDPRTEAVAFLLLTDAQQTWYLQRATKTIDAIDYQGFKLLSDQSRQFPRKYLPSEYDSPWGSVWTEDAYGYIYESTSVPADVITACEEEALAIYDSLNSSERSERVKRQEDGIISIAYGDSSETYDSSRGNHYMGLFSKYAYDLLSKYIAKSSPII